MDLKWRGNLFLKEKWKHYCLVEGEKRKNERKSEEKKSEEKKSEEEKSEEERKSRVGGGGELFGNEFLEARVARL